jgi:hypothetical protein
MPLEKGIFFDNLTESGGLRIKTLSNPSIVTVKEVEGIIEMNIRIILTDTSFKENYDTNTISKTQAFFPTTTKLPAILVVDNVKHVIRMQQLSGFADFTLIFQVQDGKVGGPG